VVWRLAECRAHDDDAQNETTSCPEPTIHDRILAIRRNCRAVLTFRKDSFARPDNGYFFVPSLFIGTRDW
jgi:hypothetical protein